jgi:acyl carrier protein
MTQDQSPVAKVAVLDDIVGILQNMTSDWDVEFSGPIGAETCLVRDLTFESIDIVQLIVAVEEHYGRRDFAFEKLLMVDGRYVDEIRVGDLVDFLHAALEGQQPASQEA